MSDIYNTGANSLGSSGNFIFKRNHSFANGKTIWDLAGNVREWNDDTCIQGSGIEKWYNCAWTEWNDTNLDDYKRGIAGPSPLFASINNAGRYWWCSANGNGLFRGGAWNED